MRDCSGMAERPVLVIVVNAVQADWIIAQLALLRARHQNAPFILLTSPQLAARLEQEAPAYDIWPEGTVRGVIRLLALLRRISWAGVSDIYDLEQNTFTRLVRLSVWPRPHWHKGAGLLPY